MTKIGIAKQRGALRRISMLHRTSILTLAIGAAIFTSAFAGAQTAPAGSAPPASAPTQTPTFNGIAHIAIRVKDIAASVAFYNKLGFQQAFAMTAKDGSVSQSFVKINDRQFMELYPVNPSNPTQDKPEFMHLCFEGADLNALHDFYVAEGLAQALITVRKAAAGNLLFTMKGPMQFAAPQNIEYTQYMPGSLHSNDFGQHLSPDRVGDKMVIVTLAMQDPTAARAFYNDKMGFVPVSGGSRLAWMYGLPGSSNEAVEIVPVENLGAKSSITLTSPDIRKSGALLHAKGVDFTDGDTLTVTDPDGNLIHIAPQPGTFKK